MRFIMAAAASAIVSMQGASGQAPLSLVGTIPLPAVEGRIDHLAFDGDAQRLFVAALGNNTVEVLDLKSNRHLKSLPGFHEPQGIAVAADVKAVVVANGQGEGAQFLDSSDFRVTRSVRLGDDSDNVRYDAAAKRLFVGFGGGALAAINAADGKVAGEAKLAAHPESFQLERNGSEDLRECSVGGPDRSDRPDRDESDWRPGRSAAQRPIIRWRLDEANHRLFVGCRRPAKVLVYDTATGKETGAFDIVGDTDDLFYDAARKRLYVTGGEGFIDVFQDDAGRFNRLAHIATAAGARTSLFVADLSRLYLAVPHRGNQKAEIRVYEAR